MKAPTLICHYNGMLCFKHTIILFFLFIINYGNSQDYPTQVSVTDITWEPYQVPTNIPTFQNSFIDPITGNNVTRISDEDVFGCDCSQLRHRYAKNQAWNADGTLIMTSGWPSKILDGETYEVLYESYTQSLWSNTDPNYTYDSASNATFVKKNIITNQVTTLRQFSEYSSISVGNNEGNLSNDDHYVALIGTSGSQKTVIVYDIFNDQIVSTKSLGTADIDWVSMSQSGEYVVISGYSDGSGPLQGIKAYDKFMNNEVHLYNGRPHGDIGYDTQGNEVYVGYQGVNGYSLSYARLDNGEKQGLFPYSGDTGDRGLWGGHVSTRNLDRPGWAYVSDQGHPTDINRHEATREIFAIKLDASQTIERFAKHNSNINISNGYNHQAHAVPNRDGSKVLFASNWDISSLENNNYPLMFVVEAAQNSDVNQVEATSNSDTICEGENAILTAAGANSYLWSTGETTASITVSPISTSTFTVTGNHSDGSTTTDNITITVNPKPTANAGSDVIISEGESTTLSASGGDSYLWSTGETTQSITVSPTSTTTYTVIAVLNGCEDTDDVVVTVENSQVVADAGEDVTICENASITLTASGGTDYLWSTGATTQNITVSPNTTTTYSVTVSNGSSSDTDDVTVTVNPKPTANAGSDVTISEGESTTLSASGGDSYLWSTGETTQSITVSPTSTTTYTVIAVLNGCEDSADIIVSVETEQVVADAGADVNICESDSVTLTASGGTEYLWSTGATTQSITVSPTSTTNYTVIVSNDSSSDTDDVTVEVNPVPEVSLSNDATILQGSYITLSASGADRYEWSNGATQPNIAVSPSVTTTYVVTGYINNCYDVKDVTVSVLQEVVVNVGDDTSICHGDDITLTATSSGAVNYLWNTGATTQSITVSPEEDTLYTVIASNSLDSETDEIMVSVGNCEEEINGIEDILPNHEAFSMKAYINPRVSEYILNVKLSGLKNQCVLYLFDISGKLIHTDEFDGNDGQEVVRTINTTGIDDGVYVIKVMNNKSQHAKSIIIR